MTTTQNRPFAVFDIDGTIMRWQFYHAICDTLAKHELVSAEDYQAVRDARMTWKKRVHSQSFHSYEEALVKAYEQTLPHVTPAQYDKVAEEVFEKYKDQVYTYTRDLVRELKAKNYLLFAISGSPSDIVEKFAEYYGFDDCAGTRQHQLDGKFTGTFEFSLGVKHHVLETMIAKHRAATTNSVGVGDTKGDIEMLSMVKRPIAFNPEKQLFEHAKTHGWQIIVERKNVVYQLQPRNGSYILDT